MLGNSMWIVHTYMQYSTAGYLGCSHCLLSNLLYMHWLWFLMGVWHWDDLNSQMTAKDGNQDSSTVNNGIHLYSICMCKVFIQTKPLLSYKVAARFDLLLFLSLKWAIWEKKPNSPNEYSIHKHQFALVCYIKNQMHSSDFRGRWR